MSWASDNKNYQFYQRPPYYYYQQFATENNWSFNGFSVPHIFVIVLWLRDFPPYLHPVLCGQGGKARGEQGGGKLWHQQVRSWLGGGGGGEGCEKLRRLIEGDRWQVWYHSRPGQWTVQCVGWSVWIILDWRQERKQLSYSPQPGKKRDGRSVRRSLSRLRK